MLAKLEIIGGSHAAERIAVADPWVFAAGSTGPRRRAHLHHQTCARIVPHQHSFGVPPRRIAVCPTPTYLRRPIELIIPHDKEERLVVDVSKGGADWIRSSFSCAPLALLQSLVAATGEHILLAKWHQLCLHV